ncbi:acyltransferase [Escherichia coli]|uniref:acyltransferase n=1 Tax=Escherichia coli TaxID=562 RepID=UPI001CA69A13|nr:acyltransferase [Escherichia coli]EMD6908065.1 acyltransferase [Citrobacter freundii]QZZ09222.1 acyltransferase [Escherichia coli]HCN8983706.1 acyltransferase [Escherichia coli]HCO3633152.1 acyltransferase [Escherichia coli]
MKVQLGIFAYRLLLNNGDVIENPQIDGLEVEFKGRYGGIVEIDEGAIFHNTKIIIGSMGHVHIKKTHIKGIRNTRIELACSCKIKTLFIDEGCSIESSRFAIVNDDNLVVKIGKDCMLSSGIVFRSCDGHTIFDISTNAILNKANPIILGDHVWVGAEATFLKGSEIPNNSIVGTGSIVSKKFTEENTAIAGIPASVVKKGINWDRAPIPIYERK